MGKRNATTSPPYRIPVPLGVILPVLVQPWGSRDTRFARMLDLGPRGMGIVTMSDLRAELPLGRPLRLTFRLPGVRRRLSLRGRVLWNDGGTVGVSLEAGKRTPGEQGDLESLAGFHRGWVRDVLSRRWREGNAPPCDALFADPAATRHGTCPASFLSR